MRHEDRLRPQLPVVSRSQEMSAHPEEILHDAVDRCDALQMGGRLEAAHLALALPRRLVGDVGAIVRALARAVDDRRHRGAVRR